jgi:glucose/arabinose dehydrogenase
VLFGPDGYLYAGMGDGGSANDPHGNGQNRGTLLGAILRLDVDGDPPYAIPADNPYAGGGGRPEIWATGVRNPWRMWIDAETRTLFFGDVGQNRWEEIDAAPLDVAGLDFGWNVMEGGHCLRDDCDAAGFTAPVLEYGRDSGCSVTGGLVYRGSKIPALRGVYLYSDYCKGWIRGFRLENGEAIERRTWVERSVGDVSSFGTDGAGEAYVATLEGTIFRIDPSSGR